MENECNLTYSFGRKKVHSIINAGFVEEKKNGEFFSFFNKTKCRIYEISIEEEQYNKLKQIINNMKLETDNFKYDFLGIALRFFHIPITFKNKYVCSYFVADVLERANIYKFNKKTCFIRPKDFENLQGFSKIYEGKYKDYIKVN